jgi:hypothetical protein
LECLIEGMTNIISIILLPPFSYLVICLNNQIREIINLNMFRTAEFHENNGIRAQIELDCLEIIVRELVEGIQMNFRLTQEPISPFDFTDFSRFLEQYDQVGDNLDDPKPHYYNNNNRVYISRPEGYYNDNSDYSVDDEDWGYRSD